MPAVVASNQERIERALRYIDNHLDEKLTLEKIASVACFSNFHFHRIFHAVTGETPNHYITRLRLQQAANRLVYQPKRPITDIALASGFQTGSAFTHCFKKRFGVSPAQWRQRNSKIEQVNSIRCDYNQIESRKSEISNYRVSVRHLDSLNVGFVSARSGYRSENIKRAWERLLRWAENDGVASEKSQLVGIALDNPNITNEKQCRYLAGISVNLTQAELPNGIGFIYIPAGKHAVLEFSGNVATIAQAYQFLYGVWLMQSEYQVADAPVYERLLIVEPDKDGNIRSNICLPLAGK